MAKPEGKPNPYYIEHCNNRKLRRYLSDSLDDRWDRDLMLRILILIRFNDNITQEPLTRDAFIGNERLNG